MKSAFEFGKSLALALLIAVPLYLPAEAGAQAIQPAYHPERILVKPAANLDNIHAALRTRVLRSYARFGGLQVVQVPQGVQVEQIVAAFDNSGLVEYAEFDHLLTAGSHNSPNDAKYTDGTLWGMNNTGQNGGTADADIDAPEGWHFRTYANETVVGVIDSGVRYTHEDLAANMWRNVTEFNGTSGVDDDNNGYVDDIYGINAITGSGNPNDDNGHGTHVAGTIGAVGNNSVGVVGVAWRTQIMALKFLNSAGSGATSDAIECIDYAISHGATVLNNSWGGGSFNQALSDAIRAAANAGVIFVAIAHNYSRDNDVTPLYPASYDLDNIVSVLATTRSDTLASYSSWGLVSVDLGAPGTDIHSTAYTNDTSYATKEGTSMAAPHVSGALALMKAQFPNDSYFQLINRVFSTTDPLTALNGRCQTGGRLNLHRALTSINSRPRNDNFSSSYQIVVPSGQSQITATGNNIDATSETGEPNHAGNSPSKSVWWHWTPSSTGTGEIRTQGSTFNTRLAVYTGSSVSALTAVASSSATDGCSWSQITTNFTAGTTYRIAVDGYNGAVGSIKLTIRTSGSTSQTTLSFDRNTVQRPSGQFKVTVVGPASQTVTLDMYKVYSVTTRYWTNYATFALSAQGTYAYTDTQATNTYRFYRASIGTLKSCNAVGYADLSMPAGYSMIANPLNAVDNRVSALLPNMSQGDTLYKWDEVTDQFVSNTFIGSAWSDPNMTLAPGEGVIISLGTALTRSFLGEFLQGYLINPVPSGLSIRGAKSPISGPVASGLGTPILEGDIVSRMISGVYQNYAYRNGFWIADNGAQVPEPVIAIGESFWINKPTDWEQISSVWP